MARAKLSHLARDTYSDVDTAIRELGTLWVLDAINRNLKYNKDRKEYMRTQRTQAQRGSEPQGEE